MEEIEIIKAEISTYLNRKSRIEKLSDKKDLLFYELCGLKAIDYRSEKGNVNSKSIEIKRLVIIERIKDIDEEIQDNINRIDYISSILKEINKSNEKIKKGEREFLPSKILIDVLCKKKTYKEAMEFYGFKSTSSLYKYIDKVIEKYKN